MKVMVAIVTNVIQLVFFPYYGIGCKHTYTSSYSLINLERLAYGLYIMVKVIYTTLLQAIFMSLIVCVCMCVCVCACIFRSLCVCKCVHVCVQTGFIHKYTILHAHVGLSLLPCTYGSDVSTSQETSK